LGTGYGSGFLGVGGPNGGAGGVFFGTGPNSVAVYGIAPPDPNPPGFVGIGGVFVGSGEGYGAIGVGGLQGDIPGGNGLVGIGGGENDGVLGYCGIRVEGNGNAGVLGFASRGPGVLTDDGRYGVVGSVSRQGSTKDPILREPAGVRGTLDYKFGLFGLDDGSVQHPNGSPVGTRDMYGGVFTGHGGVPEYAFSFQGGYGAQIIGSRSKADLSMRFRNAVPLTGKVGDMFLMAGYGLCVCAYVQESTGLAEWSGIPFVPTPAPGGVGPFESAPGVVDTQPEVWRFVGYSPYKAPGVPGSGVFEPQL